MQIQIHGQDVVIHDQLRELVEQRLAEAVEHFPDRLTRLEVHLRDMNGGKAGIDKRCTVEARPRGMEPVAVSHDADNIAEAIRQAAGKLERALKHRFERPQSRARRNVS